MNKLTITWCYPDILNLHGDRGNIMALERIGKMLDLDVEVKKIENYDENIDFENTDILFFNPGELKSVEYIINALERQRKELKNYIEHNKYIIAIGTTGAVFANRITRIDKGELIGLGFLDMNCKERDKIVGDDLICTVKDTDIKLNGNEISILDTTLNSDIEFAKVSYGYGNSGYEVRKEGARYKNLIFTNLLGPLFVKNPWYAEEIIKGAMKVKKQEIDDSIEESYYDIELKSMKAIEDYNENK
ncbi:MAG: hypothetical protein J6O62_01430 [Bacilli bacterium]|nr:hypothetical protein [Bacilli bacterium]